MVGGQAIDLACVTPDPAGRRLPPLDADGLRGMHARKTGALIRAAAVAGAIMGGGSDRAVEAIDAAAGESRPRLSDRRRHPRRRGRVGGSRQDGGQGRRGRQADLPGALRPRRARDGWPRTASHARRRRSATPASRTRGCWRSAAGSSRGRPRLGLRLQAPGGGRSPKPGARSPRVVARTRLDQLVVERGLAPSRERARALILAGQVTVDGQPVTKAGAQVEHAGRRRAARARSSVRRPRRPQARARARHVRAST